MLMSYPASKQGPLAIGERLYDLAFLDAGGQPFSFYNHRVYGWPKAIHVTASPVYKAASKVSLWDASESVREIYEG